MSENRSRKRGRKKTSLLDKFLQKKDVECNIGTVELKENLCKSIKLFLDNDKKLFENILTEALENINIDELAKEYEKKLEEENKQNSSSPSSENKNSVGVFNNNKM